MTLDMALFISWIHPRHEAQARSGSGSAVGRVQGRFTD
jgi:hypothetical protein